MFVASYPRSERFDAYGSPCDLHTVTRRLTLRCFVHTFGTITLARRVDEICTTLRNGQIPTSPTLACCDISAVDPFTHTKDELFQTEIHRMTHLADN